MCNIKMMILIMIKYIYKQKQQQQFYAYITCTSYTEKIDTENTVHPKNY